jgi:hypothetical protein
MPNYIKKPIEPLLQDKEIKTSFTDINKFVSGVVNGVDAKAYHVFYGEGFEAKNDGWRQGVRLPGWFIEELEYIAGHVGIAFLSGYAGSRITKYSAKFCFLIPQFCVGLSLLIAVYYSMITLTNRYFCNKSGVWIYKNRLQLYDLSNIPYTGCY